MQMNLRRYETKSLNLDYNPVVFRKDINKIKLDTDIESEINYDNLITEDDEPLDNLFSERQQRLLPESLYTSWDRKEPFLALANVGIYEEVPKEPIVPDVLLSLNVRPAEDIWQKKHRCYFISIFGKPPELVIEVVSNKFGHERKEKFRRYKNMGVKYYVIYDPGLHIYSKSFHAFQLKNNSYVAFPLSDLNQKRIWFKDINLGLTVQKGKYEELKGEWLRWYDKKGKILKTGQEKAEAEKIRTEEERKKAEEERKKAKISENKMKAEKKRADAAEKELALLKAKLLLLDNH